MELLKISFSFIVIINLEGGDDGCSTFSHSSHVMHPCGPCKESFRCVWC